jgi:hypothetical protein
VSTFIFEQCPVVCYFVQGWSVDVSAEFERSRGYVSVENIVVPPGQPVCILNAFQVVKALCLLRKALCNEAGEINTSLAQDSSLLSDDINAFVP